MKKNSKQSAALLMGIFIVAVVAVIAVTVSKNTIQTLSSGTNIADWDLAREAAETGLENAIIGIKIKLSKTPPEDATSPSGATETSAQFMRRNMGALKLKDNSSGGYDVVDSDPIPQPTSITAPLQYPNNQYWNYKIYKKTTSTTPGDSSSQKVSGCVSDNQKYSLSGTTWWYGGCDSTSSTSDYLQPGNKYNAAVKLGINYSSSLPSSGSLSLVSFKIQLKYWANANASSTGVFSYGTVAAPRPEPCLLVNPTSSLCARNYTTTDGMEVDVLNPIYLRADDITAVDGSGSPLSYVHLYWTYKIKEITYSDSSGLYCPIGTTCTYSGTPSFLNTSELYLANKDKNFGNNLYYITAVGQYGKTNQTLYAIYDIDSSKWWRINKP